MKTGMSKVISRTWSVFANLCAFVGISLAVSWSLLLFLRPESPVVVVGTNSPVLLTPKVHYRGDLKYTYDSERLQSCPGMVVTSFISVTNDTPAVVTLTRPVRSTEIKKYDDLLVTQKLGDSVFPGRWIMTSVVNSRCPTFERTDPLVNFEFEVVQ